MFWHTLTVDSDILLLATWYLLPGTCYRVFAVSGICYQYVLFCIWYIWYLTLGIWHLCWIIPGSYQLVCVIRYLVEICCSPVAIWIFVIRHIFLFDIRHFGGWLYARYIVSEMKRSLVKQHVLRSTTTVYSTRCDGLTLSEVHELSSAPTSTRICCTYHAKVTVLSMLSRVHQSNGVLLTLSRLD